MQQDSGKEAFGAPGMEPRWTHGNKNGVGTAYSASSKIWFTLFGGIVTEVYYPKVDRPQIRDLQYLITDGKSFFHEEKRDLESQVERLSDFTLGFKCTNSDLAGRYTITKEVMTDPYLPCLLQLHRLCHHREWPDIPDGSQSRRVAGIVRHPSFRSHVLRLCRHDRWLDGPA